MSVLEISREPLAGFDRLDVTRLQRLMINDSGFAFDPQTGQTYSINPTGVDVIRWLNEGYEPQRVVECLRKEYGVDEFTASQDYEAFVTSLRSNALIRSR
jgi:hypothetical protein